MRRLRALLLLSESVSLFHDAAGAGRECPADVVGWEGVGLASYLLIGFILRKNRRRMLQEGFIRNRIGDVGFLIGMFLLLPTSHADLLRDLSTARRNPGWQGGCSP